MSNTHNHTSLRSSASNGALSLALLGNLWRHYPLPQQYGLYPGEEQMDKDRVEGSVEQAKGAVKEAAGKVTGDSKLQTEGAADKAAGKVQNTAGGVKDAVKGK